MHLMLKGKKSVLWLCAGILTSRISPPPMACLSLPG